MTRLRLISQRLNAAGSHVIRRALRAREAVTITDLACRQVDAGADCLDLCAMGMNDEPDALEWLVATVQSVTDVPLSLNTQNPDALRRVLPLCRRPPLLNSVSDALPRFEETVALLRDSPLCSVVALCLDERGTHTNVPQRLEIASRLADRLNDEDIPPERIVFDPLTLPATAGPEALGVTLQTMTALRDHFSTSRILAVVGNYGYGLSAQRRTVEREYAQAASQAGADAFLCDLTDDALRSLLHPD